MSMRYDEDYLRELELWPHFALQRQSMVQPTEPRNKEAPEISPDAANHEPARTPLPVLADTRQKPERPVVKPPIAKSVEPAAAVFTAPKDEARVLRIAQLDWPGLQAEAAACRACPLGEKRKQAVVGAGNQQATWMLIGEAPGADEDEVGEPFVGQAGKLLDAILSAAGLARGKEVYIANVVKCRPPGNRTPLDQEALACASFLDRQIALVQPKILVALGKTAIQRLTGDDASMASFRGKLLQYQGIPLVATYHPAYLLRNPAEKRKVWEDFVFAKNALAGRVA